MISEVISDAKIKMTPKLRTNQQTQFKTMLKMSKKMHLLLVCTTNISSKFEEMKYMQDFFHLSEQLKTSHF